MGFKRLPEGMQAEVLSVGPSTRLPGGTDDQSPPVDLFLLGCLAHGLSPPTPEHHFDPTRGWRLDYAWPDARVAVEVQGGLFSGGRHTRGAALVREYEKLNAAQLAGWVVLLVTTDDVKDGSAFAIVTRALKGQR